MLEYNICKWSFIASKYVLCIYYHVSIIITYTYIIRSWIKLKQLGTKLGQCRTMLVNTWLHQGVSLQAPKSHGFFFALLTPSTWQGRLLKADVLHLLGNTSQLEKKYEKVQFGDILDLHNIIHQVKLEFVVAVGFGGIRTAFDFCTWGVAKMVWGICELIILKYWHTGLWDIHQDGLMLSGLEVSNYASNRENEACHFYNLRMSKREREMYLMRKSLS